jgi:hypothetical protein
MRKDPLSGPDFPNDNNTILQSTCESTLFSPYNQVWDWE